MLSKIEIVGFIILLVIIYLILYLDVKLRNNKNISLKTPIIVSIVLFIIYKIFKPYFIMYICNMNKVKQDIITEMADF